jgi:PPM family protein phosphatase
MRIRVGVATDVGRVRERNEDAFLVQDPVFAVADGMGGHRGGNVASTLALETLGSFRLPDQGAAEALVEDIKKANDRVMEQGESNRDLRGMGTTLTAVVREDAKAHIAHVGDSRAYLMRDNNLQQLTLDHTLVQQMVAEGRISPEEAGHHPQRSILTRALGVEDGLDVDVLTMDVHPGDRVLLCTDGLTSLIEDDSIRRVLDEEPDPQSAADRLVREANNAGGDDNITVIVLDFDRQDGAVPIADSQTAPPRSVTSRSVPPDGESEQKPEALTTMVSAPPREEPWPQARPADRRRGTPAGKRRAWRWARWLILLVGLIVAAVIGIRLFADRQWYVGDSGGRVAIYNGIPTKLLGFRLHHVVETTDLPAARAEQLQPWRDLHDGINANSLREARTIVEQIRQDVSTPGPRGGG